MLPYPVWESEKKKYKALVSEICVKGNRYRMQGLNAVMFFFSCLCVRELSFCVEWWCCPEAITAKFKEAS